MTRVLASSNLSRGSSVGPGISAVSILVAGALSATALGAAPKMVGNAAAGKRVWAAAQPPCAFCHTLLAAGARGTGGPDLDKTKPSYEKIINYVTNGRRPNSRYPKQMQAYGHGVFTKKQIEDVAVFIYQATHKSASR